MGEQIPFPLSRPEHATFDNFHGVLARPVVSLLQRLGQQQAPHLLYLWGGEGIGKSHLLDACCHHLQQQGEPTLFLPLQQFSQYASESAMDLLAGTERYRLIVLDDLQSVAGDRHWEETLFHLLNQARDRGQSLLIAAAKPLSELGLQLPDLRSRLSEAVVEQLQSLSGEEKWQVVQQRAEARGMRISDEVVTFLINRTPRDFHALFELLEQLDHQTLAAQRKITIPFVKELLAL